MLQTGQVLQDRYRIDAMLGQGGMGAVYRAYDTALKLTCVVKELLLTPDALSKPQEATAQFEREAVVLAGLRHPGLPRVTNYFADPARGGYFLIMDLIEGQTLQSQIPLGGLPEHIVLGYADQLLEILQYIHAHGVVHRDIKPANIIIQPDGRPILVDFGLVKVIQSSGELTTRGYAHGMGTPEYAPPEQAIGRTDQRSDIYSLGATLYYALTGYAPASASDRVTEKPLISPRQLQSGISLQTEQVILRAMALMKSDRYPDAKEMRTALQRSEQPAVVATPQPLLLPVQLNRIPLARKSVPLWVSVVVVMAVAIVAIIAVVTLIATRVIGTLAPPTVAPTLVALSTESPIAEIPGITPFPTQMPTPTSAPTHTPTPSSTPKPTPLPQPSNSLVLALAPGVSMELVRVPAGEFLMGSSDSDKDAQPDEKPQSKINLDEFLIGKYDVTNAQFAAFVNAIGYKTTAEQQGSGWVNTGRNWADTKGADWQHPRGPGSSLAGRDNYPVGQVSWDDAVAFCTWASQVTGRKIHLPSEAQWEKAARGMDGRIYPWGNAPPDSSRMNFASTGAGEDTMPVGQYSPKGDSPYGAADMAGNVSQWTSSLWGSDPNKPTFDYPYNANDGREDASSRDLRVFRGGGFDAGAMGVRAAARSTNVPWLRNVDIGFRVVASPN